MSDRVQKEIIEIVQKIFDPELLDVVNESHNHSVPKGSESHFKLVCVSVAFEGKSRVQRQREIYEALSDVIKNKIHALALHTFTPEEWKRIEPSTLLSPQCLHKR